jgi:hypothetical protein
MKRSEALDMIRSALPAIDDERIETLAEIAMALARPPSLGALTPHEIELLDRAKADFATGRTLGLSEARAASDALFAELASRRG